MQSYTPNESILVMALFQKEGLVKPLSLFSLN